MARKRDKIIGTVFVVVLGMSCLYVMSESEDRPQKTPGYSPLDWIWNDYELALDKARTQNKYVLIDFWAEWCTECKEMDKIGFQSPEVVQLLDRVVLLKVDTGVAPQVKAQFRVGGLPTIIVVNAAGEEVARAVGYQDTEQLKAFLQEVLP